LGNRVIGKPNFDLRILNFDLAKPAEGIVLDLRAEDRKLAGVNRFSTRKQETGDEKVFRSVFVCGSGSCLAVSCELSAVSPSKANRQLLIAVLTNNDKRKATNGF
jgi:hypothetical protein